MMYLDNVSLETYLGVSGVITQSELPMLRAECRLGNYAVVYRIYRAKKGGGFGDQEKHPYCWAILLYVDSLLLRVNSARGERREWSSLDGAAQWLDSEKYVLWWTRNDLESLH